MKPKISLIIMLLCAVTCVAQQPYTNVIKFYLHPDLVTDVEAIRTNLIEYVADMNHILAKNTQHQVEYDPDTGLIVQSFAPFNGMELNAPRTNYEIRVWIRYSTFGLSYGDGGYSSDIDGSAGITSLFWLTVWNPNNIPDYYDFIDYRQQLIALLHGYGQIYGAGLDVGEIWNMAFVTDNTGVPPKSDIKMINNPGFFWNYNDIYWGPNFTYYGDPMIGAFETADRAAMLSLHRYSGLSSTIIRNNYRYYSSRPPLASQNGVRTRIMDSVTCRPLDGARVRIWRINPSTSVPTALLVDEVTGTNGTITWNWQSQTPNYYGDSIRLIKVSRTGFPTNAAVLTSLDLQATAVFDGYSNLTNEIRMVRQKLKLLIAKSNLRVTITNVVPGRAFALQATTNLNSGWTTLTNYTPTSTANIIYNHPAGAPSVRFYRTEEYTECPIFLEMQEVQQQEVQQPALQARRPFVRKNFTMPPLPPHPSEWKTR